MEMPRPEMTAFADLRSVLVACCHSTLGNVNILKKLNSDGSTTSAWLASRVSDSFSATAAAKSRPAMIHKLMLVLLLLAHFLQAISDPGRLTLFGKICTEAQIYNIYTSNCILV